MLELGYEAGRETSLQVLERCEPDMYVRHAEDSPLTPRSWDYLASALAISAEPGIAFENSVSRLDALTIKDLNSDTLVTIVEAISPGNKIDPHEVQGYQERRESILRKGINVLEIATTRSVKRLVRNVLAAYAYHIAVFLPGQPSRIIGVDAGQPLQRVALPLRGEVIAMEIQESYDFAYQQASIGGQIYSDGNYDEVNLPFPSLLIESQRSQALEKVRGWIERLNQLKSRERLIRCPPDRRRRHRARSSALRTGLRLQNPKHQLGN